MTPEQAAQKYHWCKYDKNTNTVELYLDHYMLSGLRLCEAKFYLEHLLWVKPKPIIISEGQWSRKPWFLDFGEYIHWCLEQFYNHFKHNKTAPSVDFWMQQCRIKWLLMKMDEYKDSVIKADATKYHDIHGWDGVATLLIQYYVFYMDMRLRVIDTEITFGHNKEVFVGGFKQGKEHWSPYRLYLEYDIKCYLTGRIDLLVDNGYKIGPVDHKTTHKFDGFEHKDFNPQDAMTGYIYATHEILKNYSHDISEKIPECKGGWIFHISACTPSTPRDKTQKQGPRFKTTPIDKTTSQLEDFKQRQLSTFKRVAELLFNDKTPEWNTTACNNIFFRQCEYKPIHEQPSEQWKDTIERFYQISSPWDTRNMAKKETDNESTKASGNAGVLTSGTDTREENKVS
jgi:hypothetical protein